jgi:hypothetical protein
LEPPPYLVTTKRCLGCEALDDERKLVEEGGGQDRAYNYGFQKNREEP